MTITAELADGRRLEFPDGTDPSVIQSTVKKVIGQNAPEQRSLTNDNPNAIDKFILDKFGSQLAKAPDIQGSVPGRFIQGLADLPVGAMQLGMNLAGQGDVANPAITEMGRRTEQLRGPDAGFDFARLAGNLASPIPYAAAAKLAPSAGAAGRIFKGGVLPGAAGGAAAPVAGDGDYKATKAGQITMGALLGAILPAGLEGAKGVGRLARNVFDPVMSGGATRSVGRLANEVAGDKADEVIAALNAAKTGQTAGQAAVPVGSARFSALQKIASSNDPDRYAAIDAAQAGVRQRALQGIAGGADDTALDAAVAARKAATDPLYKAAESNVRPVNVSAMADKIDDLLSRKPGNTELVTELNKIKGGIMGSSRNVGFGPSRTQADAEGIISTIDGIKAAIAKKDNKFIQSQLIELRDGLKASVPGYKQADDTFRELSKPVNQMQVGRALEKSLTNPSNAETAGSYLRAIDDATKMLKKATGFSRYSDISDVLTPAQAAQAKGIALELENNLKLKSLSTAGAKKTNSLVGDFADAIPQTNFLSRPMMIINAITRRIEGKASKVTIDELSKKMADPKEMAKIMLAAKPYERKAIVDSLIKYQAMVGGQVAGQSAPQ